MASESKKRRRSSLAAAKIREDDIYHCSSQGLYRQIPMGLSPEEKLQELSRLCLKASMETICQESGSQEVKERLDCVKDELFKMVDTEEYKNILKSACGPPETLPPNPANTELDRSKEELEGRINRLHKEEVAWTELLTDIDRHTQDAERKFDNLVLPVSELTEGQKEFSKQYLPDLADLDSVKQQVDTSLNTFYILLREHEESIDLLVERQRKADINLDKLQIRLQEKTFPVMDSPDAILQRLQDLPSTVEEQTV